MHLDLNDDVPKLRKYIADRVRAQSDDPTPISAVEVGFRMCQVGLYVITFDTRPLHAADGGWTDALNGPTVEFPHWQEACEARDGVTFVLLDGTTRELPPGCNDIDVATTIGEALRSMAVGEFERGTFASLPLRGDCQLDVEEFEGIWLWPGDSPDRGQRNILRDLAADRLPK